MTRRPSAGVVTGAALVIVSCSAVQGSAALSSTLFDTLEPAEVAAWRQAFGALALLVILRPRLAGRTGAEWTSIAGLGVAIATMNVAFFQTVDIVPLGVAATLLYLGPFALAVAHTRVARQLSFPLLALVGVALVCRPSGDVDSTGIVAGLVAAAALAAYTLTSQRLGRAGGTRPARPRRLGVRTGVEPALGFELPLRAASRLAGAHGGGRHRSRRGVLL